MPAIITVDNISKLYHIASRQTDGESLVEVGSLRDSLGRLARNPLSFVRRNGEICREELWALKDISFSVDKGEIVGIIGRNGAGKSTLLKILSRITEPTSGRVDLWGRVGSLLEIGTGFHPELTGRENIFLNGAVLGMKHRETREKFADIVAFSELERFIDTPVKYYSSGMYTRLAFAVAAHLDPEILVVDEVLAVGDAAFQKKCLGKMDSIASKGRTILFVSHNMAAIQTLCSRVLWLKDGKIIQDGGPGEVVSQYLKTVSTVCCERVWEDMYEAPGNDQVRLRRAQVRPRMGSNADDMTIRTPLMLEFDYWNLEPGAHLNLSVHIRDEQGMTIFETFPIAEQVWHGKPFPVGLFRSVCHIPGDLLNDGLHRALLVVVKDEGKVLFTVEDVLIFNVLDSADRRCYWHGKCTGAVRPDLKWETEFLGQDGLRLSA